MLVWLKKRTETRTQIDVTYKRAKMVELTIHPKAVNLARRFTVQNENDLLRELKTDLGSPALATKAKDCNRRESSRRLEPRKSPLPFLTLSFYHVCK